MWNQILIEIDLTCRAFDSTWQKRRRVVDTKIVVFFILELFNNRNSKNYSSTLSSVWSFFRGKASAKSNQLLPVVASTICDARQKVDASIFSILNNRIIEISQRHTPPEQILWRGLNLFAIDGSKVNLPCNTGRLGFDFISKNTDRPQGLLSCLYSVSSQVPFDFSLESHGDERLSALGHLKVCPPNSLVIYDRGYIGYLLLKEHAERGIFGLFRIQRGSFPAFQKFIDDPTCPAEQIAEVIPSIQSQNDMRKKNKKLIFYPIKMRLMRYKIEEKEYFLATTLLDQSIPIDEFKTNYHQRWSIEELYKKSKTLLNLESFHSKSLRGIRQEVFASLFLITMTRILTNQGEAVLLVASKSGPNTQPKKKSFQFERAFLQSKSISSML